MMSGQSVVGMMLQVMIVTNVRRTSVIVIIVTSDASEHNFQ